MCISDYSDFIYLAVMFQRPIIENNPSLHRSHEVSRSLTTLTITVHVDFLTIIPQQYTFKHIYTVPFTSGMES